jgi:hypothetical protein
MTVYLGRGGLAAAAAQLDGTESLHVGIRPWGLHAGNQLSLVAYPILLCDLMAERQIEPRFRLFVSLNDMEPAEITYPLGYDYPFNIRPGRTSFEHTPDPFSCCASISLHYEDEIREALGAIRAYHPGVTLEFVRNSDLRSHPGFKRVVLETITRVDDIAAALRESSGSTVAAESLALAGAICRSCHSAHGSTRVAQINGSADVWFDCATCGRKDDGAYEDYSFWMYYLPLRLARLDVLQFVLHLTGGDHGDIAITERLSSVLLPRPRRFPAVIGPTLIAADGRRMAKRFGNCAKLPIEQVLTLARNCNDSTTSIGNV